MSDDGNKGHTTQIAVALIGVLGVIATALFANWDKVFPDRPEGPPTATQSPDPYPSETPSPVPSGETPSPTPEPSTPAPEQPTDPARQFVGTWSNVDNNTRGTTRWIIRKSGNNLVLQGYGSCSPTDCKYDPVTVPASAVEDGVLVFTRESSFAIRRVTLKLDGTRMRDTTRTRYTDNSGRPDRTSRQEFRKQLITPVTLGTAVPVNTGN